MTLANICKEIKNIIGDDHIFSMTFSDNSICIDVYEVRIPIEITFGMIYINTFAIGDDINIDLGMIRELEAIITLLEENKKIFIDILKK